MDERLETKETGAGEGSTRAPKSVGGATSSRSGQTSTGRRRKSAGSSGSSGSSTSAGSRRKTTDSRRKTASSTKEKAGARRKTTKDAKESTGTRRKTSKDTGESKSTSRRTSKSQRKTTSTRKTTSQTRRRRSTEERKTATSRRKTTSRRRRTTPLGGLGDLLADILTKRGAGESHPIIGPILERLGKGLGLSKEASETVVDFVLKKLLAGRKERALAAGAEAGESPAAEGLDLYGLLEQMGGGREADRELVISSGAAAELSQGTGLDRDTAIDSLVEVLGTLKATGLSSVLGHS